MSENKTPSASFLDRTTLSLVRVGTQIPKLKFSLQLLRIPSGTHQRPTRNPSLNPVPAHLHVRGGVLKPGPSILESVVERSRGPSIVWRERDHPTHASWCSQDSSSLKFYPFNFVFVLLMSSASQIRFSYVKPKLWWQPYVMLISRKRKAHMRVSKIAKPIT